MPDESFEQLAEEISENYSELYYYAHLRYSRVLTHQSVRALQFIGLNAGARVEGVSEHLGSKQNTTSEILQRLAEKGLITRQRSAADERAVELHLTPEGVRVLRENNGLDTTKVAQWLAVMSPAEREQAQRGLALLLRYAKAEGETA